MNKKLKIGLSFIMFMGTIVFSILFSMYMVDYSSEAYKSTVDNLSQRLNSSGIKASVSLHDAYDDDIHWTLDFSGDFQMRYINSEWNFFENNIKIGSEYSHDIDFKLKFDIKAIGTVSSEVDLEIFKVEINDKLEFKPLPDERYYNLWEKNGQYADASDETKIYTFNFIEMQRPAITGDSVIANVDKPYSLEQIKAIANLKAIDPYFGDISDDIEIESETYMANRTKVGTWEINYYVINGAGLRTDFKLLVPTKDLAGPLINGPASATHSYTDELTETDILGKFTVTDNTDDSPVVTLNNGGYTQNKVGTFNMVITAVDKYNNRTTKTFALTIVDDQVPTFKDDNPGTIEFSYTDSFADAKLILGLSATDFIDGDLTKSIKVVSNPLKPKLGVYTVKYEVKDKAGNIGYFEKQFEVVTLDHPEFYVGANVINIEDVNIMSVEDILMHIARYENFEFFDYKIIEDEYSGNDTKGRYMLRAELYSEDGAILEVSRVINIFNADDLNKDATLTIWEKIGRFFKMLWDGITTFFGWIWTGIKFVWNYTIGGLFKLIGKLFTKSVLMFFLTI